MWGKSRKQSAPPWTSARDTPVAQPALILNKATSSEAPDYNFPAHAGCEKPLTRGSRNAIRNRWGEENAICRWIGNFQERQQNLEKGKNAAGCWKPGNQGK